MKTRAICTAVDRVAAKCLVQFPLPSGSALQPRVLAMRYKGDPPSPLTYVEVEEVKSGSWICNGSQANIEKRFVDDFDVATITVAGSELSSQTSWTLDTGGPGFPPDPTAASYFDYGSLEIATSTTNNDYIGVMKRGLSHEEDGDRNTAWWLEAKCTLVETTSRRFSIGLQDDNLVAFSPIDCAQLVSSTATSSGELRFVCAANPGTPTTDQLMGFTPAANVPFIIQVMILGNQWAAAWVVESSTTQQDLASTVHGPFSAVTNIPLSGCGPCFYLGTLAAAAKHARIDYVRLSSVSPVVHPNEVLSA